MLRLITNNNVERKTDQKTCATHCAMYDAFTEECAIWKGVDTTNPQYFASCKDQINYESIEQVEEERHSDFEEPIAEEGMIDTFETLCYQGEPSVEIDYQYPLAPDIDSNRDDAIWYVAPDQSFGCWIVNHSEQTLMSVDKIYRNKQLSKKGKTYASPYPLHDHQSSISLASNICWYVDEDGIGAYRFLMSGEIFLL
ncbi:hypothetical protein GCM10011351_20740 [Paraliobacillus quinghaiensis]|uniref:Uncharacterized protein n=1 Tax=Paraliobacillus quinghaiensis TaxID=470815 RepID=A0A917TS24_9BACI|nr:hypothetical protein [Paraliobacillus quinghaiensis]GGM34585.1 hypothetical protein GCM10011351_20740 [Paraliobacillus quinghaiensis]